MRHRFVPLLLGVALLVGVVGGTTLTASASGVKATGGGTTSATAANGDFLAFTGQIQNKGSTVGQVQWNDHSGAKYHGVVTCIYVLGSFAALAGYLDNGALFTLFVVDGGKGNTDYMEFVYGSFYCGPALFEGEAVVKGDIVVRS